MNITAAQVKKIRLEFSPKLHLPRYSRMSFSRSGPIWLTENYAGGFSSHQCSGPEPSPPFTQSRTRDSTTPTNKTSISCIS